MQAGDCFPQYFLFITYFDYFNFYVGIMRSQLQSTENFASEQLKGVVRFLCAGSIWS